MRNLRILLAAGPGNVVETFRLWLRGEHDISVPDVAYSQQFLDVCRELGAEAWIISSNPKVDLVENGPFRVENRPIPFDWQGGAAFHAGRVLYTLGLLRSAIEFRAEVLVVGHGVHWFLLRVFSLFGVKVVPAIHNTLWLASIPPRPLDKFLLRLARPLFAEESLGILSHPGACADQVLDLTDSSSRPIFPFIPLYREATFAGLPEFGDPRPPFRVLFAGRIEPEKGVFDLLEIARRFAERGRSDIEFDVCGTGLALEALRQAVAKHNLQDRFRVHGRLEMADFRAMFGRCHTVVVPTRSVYSEGFNAVVAEAVLSGRPVVTSRLCPAIEVVRDAVVEVEPEDLADYANAILRLGDDAEFYEAKRQACARLKGQFVDWNRSWGAALAQILRGYASAARDVPPHGAPANEVKNVPKSAAAGHTADRL